MNVHETLISFVVTCKGRLQHLKLSLPTLARQPNSQTILVDYSCPDGSADWASQHFPSVKIVRLNEQGVFNLSRARNEGAKHAAATWICFVDADVLLAPQFCENIAEHLEHGFFCVFDTTSNKNGIGGSCVVKQRDQLEVGGYDEAIDSWGSEDKDLYWRFENAGIKTKILQHDFIEDIFQHSDDSRTQFSSQKDIRLSHIIGSIYRYQKYLLLKVARETMRDLDSRKALYAQCKRIVEESYKAGTTAEFILEIPTEKSIRFPFAEVKSIVKFEVDLTKLLLADRYPREMLKFLSARANL